MTQILITVGVFVVTLTKGAPVFPVIIIALVPIRLLLMRKFWKRETLMLVDAWACRAGNPEGGENNSNINQRDSLAQMPATLILSDEPAV